MRILTVNAGSTSLKLRLLDGEESVRTYDSLDEALDDDAPEAVAHRVVHGGLRERAAVVDDELLLELSALIDLAPLHQPPALAAIERCREQLPTVPQVACFDTAFHRTIPAAATTYAIPKELRSQVRVFGFHGLSHAWASRQVRAIAPDSRRVVVAHLGGGQSLCAVRDGRSVMTTMGFTPLDGLVMATRSGALDPGAVLWLANAVPDLASVLDQHSGLLALAGTPDMREVQRRRAEGDPDARLAFDVWRHRAVALLGSCIAVLGGLDALAFTGGIGEHDVEARDAILHDLAWVGMRPADATPDGSADITELSASPDPPRAFVVRAREDLQMAGEATSLLGGP